MTNNNYREKIIKLEAQLEVAIAQLSDLDPSIDWEERIESDAKTKMTPDYYQQKLDKFKANTRANLKPNRGRKPAKLVEIDGKLTTYRQAAEEAGVSVSAIYNRLARSRKKNASESCTG